MNTDYNQEDQHNDSTFANTAGHQADSSLPTKLKLDLHTPMEVAFRAMLAISGLITVASLIAYFGGETGVRAYLTGGIVLTIISAILLNATDNYYIIDTSREMMLYHYKFFATEELQDFAPFSSIHAATVNGRKRNTKRRHRYVSWWEYRAEIVLDTGDVYPIDNWKEQGFTEARNTAKNLAAISGANFVEPTEECMAIPKRLNTGKYTFEISSQPLFHIRKYFFLKLGIALVGLFAFIYLFYTIQIVPLLY